MMKETHRDSSHSHKHASANAAHYTSLINDTSRSIAVRDYTNGIFHASVLGELARCESCWHVAVVAFAIGLNTRMGQLEESSQSLESQMQQKPKSA